MTSMLDILNIFEKFRMYVPPQIDKYTLMGRGMLAEKLLHPFNNKEPLPFYMLGLPFKSINNRDKVLGVIPDLGEEIMLKHFGTFNDAIKEIYTPGISMNIISDGFAFNDLMGVFDNTVFDYEEQNIELTKGLPITIYDMTHFYGKHMRINTMREKLTEQFGISDLELERRINFDIEVNMMYKGMIHFMEGDLAIHSYNSRNQLHKAAKEMARRMMIRNEAYSTLVNDNFKNYVKLSMHPSENNGKKYSFQLIPGKSENITQSPWHSALSINKDGEYFTIHRSDAIKAGMELIYRNNQPYYFINNNTTLST